jgi:nucleoside phosphorylase
MATPTRAEYTIGWICALVTEYIAAQEFLDVEHPRPDGEENSPGDENNYAHGSIGGHNVVIAVLPKGDYGSSSTSTVVTNLVRSYPNARVGLMVGIGGGAPTSDQDIRLGDVVVSEPGGAKTGAFQYDFGKHIQGEEYKPTRILNKPPAILRTALSGLQARYQRKGHKLGESINAVLDKNRRLRKSHGRPDASTDILFKSDALHSQHCWGQSCAQTAADNTGQIVIRVPRDEEEEDIKLHYGTVATANSVMKDAKLRDKFAHDEGVLCFEMEAGGLMDSLPCIVIRGICDYSDSHKHKQWQGYAAMAAAAFAKELLLEVSPQRVQSEKQLSKVLNES